MAKQTPTSKQIYDLLPMHSDISNIIYSYVDNPFIITLKIANTIVNRSPFQGFVTIIVETVECRIFERLQ